MTKPRSKLKSQALQEALSVFMQANAQVLTASGSSGQVSNETDDKDVVDAEFKEVDDK
jgi:preprotein translocase subunit YajC